MQELLDENARTRQIRAELRDILNVVLRAGQLLLENSANTARVEDTMRRTAIALGAQSLDTHVTPTGIFVTIHSNDEHRTRILRIVGHGVDLSRVEAVLAALHDLEDGKLDRAQMAAQLEEIAKQPREYSKVFTAISVGVAGASFCVLFGCGFWEFVVVFISGFLMQFIRAELNHRHANRLLMTGIISAAVTCFALLFTTLLNQNAEAIGALLPWMPTPHADPALAVAAGGILPIPGILMVSSIADLFRGDTLAGMARSTIALLTIFAISIGIWLVLLTIQMTTGLKLEIKTSSMPPILTTLIAGGFGAAGFGIVFDVPRRRIFFAGLVGSVATGVRWVAVQKGGLPLEAAALLAGIGIALISELWAVIFKAPTSMFTIAGFIPLVPGVFSFRAILNFAEAKYTEGTTDMVRALLITMSVAAGMGIVTAMTRIRPNAPRQVVIANNGLNPIVPTLDQP